jgi:hypothetical protein
MRIFWNESSLIPVTRSNFTNLSGHACRLNGHPGSPRSPSAAASGQPTGWAPPAPPSVRLARGATGYALVQYSDVIVSGSGPEPCHAVTAAGLRVYPPDQTRSRIVPFRCGRARAAGWST